jgi:segregation and condensation protein A
LNNNTYQIKLPQFEGPFDLLLFFIERDELDIYNIPITRIINDFLTYIHSQESLNIELSSEFILFISTLMRIKAKMLLPRKEVDAQGNEIDPRQELVDKILEYKKYKEAAVRMAEMEAERMLMVRRGNIQKELAQIGEESGEGTEMQTISAMVARAQGERTLTFEKIFAGVENRVHAIFTFLSMLELVSQRYLRIIIGEGKNNFVIEYNESEEGLTDEEHMRLL